MLNERHGQSHVEAIPLFLGRPRPLECASLPTYWEIGGKRPRKFLPLYQTGNSKSPHEELEEAIIQVGF